MQSNTTIHPLGISDVQQFQRIRLRALKEHPEAFGQAYQSQRDTPIEAVEERLRQIFDSPRDFIMGLFIDNELKGMTGFVRSKGEKVQHKGTIWGVYVAAEAQGKGLGKALISEAIERASADSSLIQIHLGVAINNDRAYRLYQSLGFETYGTEHRAIYISGTYFDEALMVKYLKPLS